MEDELKYSYNVLKFDLTAGMSDIEVPIHAQRIDYVSPTDGPEISIRLQRKSNDALPLRPNGSIEAPFTRLYISAAAVAKTVFLMVGAPAAVRVTGRDVAISGSIQSDQSKDFESYLVNQGVYYGGGGENATTAAQFGNIALRNTGTETIELVRGEFWTNIAANVSYGLKSTGPLTSTFGSRKRSGTSGAGPFGEVRGDSQVAVGAYLGFGDVFASSIPTLANTVNPHQIRGVTVPPGWFFIIASNIASARIGAVFSWKE